MKFFVLLLVSLSSTAQAGIAGTPEQDRNVRTQRDQFTKALPTYPMEGWNFGENWVCRSYNAFHDDFYSEPDATIRLQAAGAGRLVSNGNMIFKDIVMTSQGLQSVQENEAYGNEPLYMTVRPIFTYANQKGHPVVKSVRLIGEVSVSPNILKTMANYYGYAKAFTGIASVVDPSKTVYYYFSCFPATERVTNRAEARSRTWSIPAELSRHWPAADRPTR